MISLDNNTIANIAKYVGFPVIGFCIFMIIRALRQEQEVNKTSEKVTPEDADKSPLSDFSTELRNITQEEREKRRER